MKKLLQKSLVALALFGVADAAFAVERRSDATNEQIDTRNNGWPAKEAFRIVAQRVTMASLLGDERVTNEMRTELNVRFRTFLEEWGLSELSEDVVSADELMRLVTHPVLDSMGAEGHRRIYRTALSLGRTDIVRHCLGSQAFRTYVMGAGGDAIGRNLCDLYTEALYTRYCAQENGEPATQRDEERAIAALFLAETDFASMVYTCRREGNRGGLFETLAQTPPTNATSSYFLPAQLNYIMRGEIVSGVDEHVRMLQHNVNHNVEEDLWQNANPGRVLDNLDRLRSLGLTIPDSVAFRLFTDGNMRTVADRLIVRYIETGETVLSETFLQRLESSGQGMRIFRVQDIPSGVGLEILRSEEEPFIPDDELRGRFMKVRKRSRDAFDALYRQRVEGQGHANQLNQNDSNEDSNEDPYEETKDQRQGQGKR